MSTIETLKHTPLYQQHLALGAKMVPFGGWMMPLQYAGILSEYEAARKDVTVFDTSHMGEFIIEGEALASGLDRLVTQPLADMAPGQCRYGLLLNEQGGVLDDLIVYRLATARWMVVVNGATMERDAAHMAPRVQPSGAFHNISDETAKLDIQGPRSRAVLEDWLPELDRLAYFTFAEMSLFGEKVIVSRTGYTGELGFEIYLPRTAVPRLWQALLERGVVPAGLGARDVLRLEMGYSLYGHELSEDILPLEAGLGRFLDGEKDFIGKGALEARRAAGVARVMVGLLSETRRSPRAEQEIFSASGVRIGRVTSGTFSPALKRGIGLGLISTEHARIGTRVRVGEGVEAQVARRPFYTQGSLKN